MFIITNLQLSIAPGPHIQRQVWAGGLTGPCHEAGPVSVINKCVDSAAVIHTDDIIHGNLLKQTQALIGRYVYFCLFVCTCYHGHGSHCTYDNHIWTQHTRVRVILFMCIVLYVLRVCGVCY